MVLCRATKVNGEPCTLPAKGPHGFCWAHDPQNAEQRRKQASRAARSKPNREVRGLKKEVKDLIAAVKAGDQDRADAAVMLQGYRVLKDFLELEKKLRELDEIQERLRALEEAGEQQKGGRAKPWGA